MPFVGQATKRDTESKRVLGALIPIALITAFDLSVGAIDLCGKFCKQLIECSTGYPWSRVFSYILGQNTGFLTHMASFPAAFTNSCRRISAVSANRWCERAPRECFAETSLVANEQARQRGNVVGKFGACESYMARLVLCCSCMQ